MSRRGASVRYENALFARLMGRSMSENVKLSWDHPDRGYALQRRDIPR